MAAIEILLACILLPVAIVCFVMAFALPAHARPAELLPAVFVRVFGDARQRQRLRAIMAAREEGKKDDR